MGAPRADAGRSAPGARLAPLGRPGRHPRARVHRRARPDQPPGAAALRALGARPPAQTRRATIPAREPPAGPERRHPGKVERCPTNFRHTDETRLPVGQVPGLRPPHGRNPPTCWTGPRSSCGPLQSLTRRRLPSGDLLDRGCLRGREESGERGEANWDGAKREGWRLTSAVGHPHGGKREGWRLTPAVRHPQGAKREGWRLTPAVRHPQKNSRLPWPGSATD